MKIGVFGDSFAVNLMADKSEYFWVHLLAQHGYQVNNYAKSGTNLYWSYTMLEKHAHECDLLILAVTNAHRFFIPSADNEHVQHAFTINQVERLLQDKGRRFGNNGKFSDKDMHILKTLKEYIVYVSDIRQEALFHSMLVERIKKEYSNIILIPTRHGCINSFDLFTTKGLTSVNSMGDISLLDMDYCDLSWSNMVVDRRPGHMSSENNVIFTDELIQYIESDRKEPFKIKDLSIYKKPTISKKEFIEKYFRDDE